MITYFFTFLKLCFEVEIATRINVKYILIKLWVFLERKKYTKRQTRLVYLILSLYLILNELRDASLAPPHSRD